MKLGRDIMKFINDEGHKMSVELAEERGSFPSFAQSTLADRYKNIRNATVTTIAPTGTISIISAVSSGIEPIFAVAYVRNVMDKDILPEVNPIFEEVARERGFYTDELMKEIAAKGSLKEMKMVPEDVSRLFVTALDISPEWHIRMQAAFQEHTDNAVSKTVNFSHDATMEDVAKVYQLAYELGCKGVTIYRDRSRLQQVLYKGVISPTQEKLEYREMVPETERRPKDRQEVIHGSTRKIRTGCGNLYVTVNEDGEGNLFEIFNQIGKAGGCAASQSEAIGRLVSLAFRSGIEPEIVIRQLKGISCHMPVWHQQGKILSCADAIGKAVEWHLQIKTSKREVTHEKEGNPGDGSQPLLMSLSTKPAFSVSQRGACPECGSPLLFEEGCVKCYCGYSDCG